LPTDADRAVTWVNGPGGRTLAALVHDPFLAGQPQYRQRLDAVVAAARLALENARLSAENRAHLRGVLDVELADRRRIRAALHDGPQHRLSNIQLLVGQARRGNGDPGLDAALEQISAELRAAVQDLREVTEGVYPAILHTKGLEDALDSMVQRSPVPLVLDIPPTRWPKHLEETIFFLVSEAVGNAHKHAHASRITVCVWPSDNQVNLEVKDDGAGGAAPRATGSGIRGMRDRFAAHEGTLTITSPPGGGTTVRAVLPCD
jgi:signal transduction histidine kinase